MSTTRLSLVAAVFLTSISSLVACQVAPPPLWAQGGAPLTFTASVWTQADGEQLRLDDQGRVWAHDELVYALDRAGRVVDDANDPVALLDPDGQLFGTNQSYWGRVGLHNAAPPWAPEAWLRVTRRGEVVLFDADGETVSGGQWSGCRGDSLRACTLITHVVLLESVQKRQSGPDLYFGLGFGYYY